VAVSCLYKADYGPAEPGFDALAGGGRLIKGFTSHAAVLAQARNLAQLEAMERKLQRGEKIMWCDDGYGWVEGRSVDALFAVIAVAVILPYAVWKAKRRVLPRWRRHGATTPTVSLSSQR
jgi:hypothetical protein